MIAGYAAQYFTIADGFERSFVSMQHPAPRAPDHAVFPSPEYFAPLRLFNFRNTFAGFYLQFVL
jgi:hypothetical protein